MQTESSESGVQGTNLYEQIMQQATGDAPVEDDGQVEQVEEEEPVQETEQEEQQPEEEAQPEAPPTFKVKVGAEEVDVTLDELQAGYQRQADYTRKTQELAAQRRELEETAARLRSQVIGKQAPEALVQDPYAVIERVNQELQVLDQQLQECLQKDDIFTAPKIQYRQRQLERMADAAMNRISQTNNMVAQLKTEIPNLDERTPALTKFLADVLQDDPLTDSEIANLTNPFLHGRLAVKIVKLVNKLYEQTTQSKKVAEEKIVKQQPQTTVKPGNQPMAPQKKTDAQIAWKKAKSDGSPEAWADAIGRLTASRRKGT